MISVSMNHITKTYEKGKVMAVNDISFEVEKGGLFGLIGPDGAGKSTIFRMLTTLLIPDSGNATVDGFDIVKDYKAIRSRVGYMPGKFSLYQDLTVEENINFFATLFGTTVQENYDLIKEIYSQIEPFKNRKAGNLSGGMKQKLALSCALVHRPTVLFLDEPTTGVDTVSRKEFWQMLHRLKAQGITILVSTPYMDEAGQCDKIALIYNGKIMEMDTPDSIIKKYPDKLFAVKADDMHGLIHDLRKYEGTLNCFAFGEFLHLSLKQVNGNSINLIRDYLNSKGHTDIEIKVTEPTIEDCFIEKTFQYSLNSNLVPK